MVKLAVPELPDMCSLAAKHRYWTRLNCIQAPGAAERALERTLYALLHWQWKKVIHAGLPIII